MPPNNLAVYLSNRCNLACRYCYVAVNRGEPSYLCAAQAADAIGRIPAIVAANNLSIADPPEKS